MRMIRALCCVLLTLTLLLGLALAADQRPVLSVSGGGLVASFTPGDRQLAGKLMYQLVDAEENVVESAVRQGFEWRPTCSTDGEYKIYVYYVDSQGFTCMVESDWVKAAGLQAGANPEPTAVPVLTATPVPVNTPEPTAAPADPASKPFGDLLVLTTIAPAPTETPEAVEEVPAEGELYILDIVESDEGFVTVTWYDEGDNAPYRILFKRVNVDGTTDHQVGWFYDETMTAITLTELEPGRTYQIILRDKNNQQRDMRTFTLATPSAFDGLGNLKMTWSKLFSGDRMLDEPTADALVRDYKTGAYRLRSKFTFDTLRGNHDFSILCVVTAPNGFEYTHQEKIEFRYGEKWATWQWDVDYMLEVMIKEFGYVLSGEYYVSTYHDGEYMGTQSFVVK